MPHAPQGLLHPRVHGRGLPEPDGALDQASANCSAEVRPRALPETGPQAARGSCPGLAPAPVAPCPAGSGRSGGERCGVRAGARDLESAAPGPSCWLGRNGRVAPQRRLWTLSCVVVSVTGKSLVAQHPEVSLEAVWGWALGPGPGGCTLQRAAWGGAGPAACVGPALKGTDAAFRSHSRDPPLPRKAVATGCPVGQSLEQHTGSPSASAVTPGQSTDERPFTRGCSRFGWPAALQEQDRRTGDKEGSGGGGGHTWD